MKANLVLSSTLLLTLPIHAAEDMVFFESKVRPVLVYCAGGYRSRKAVSILRELGFVSIHNLHRGFHSWRLAGLPVELNRP